MFYWNGWTRWPSRYTRRECHLDLNILARFARVRLIHATAEAIDVQKKEARQTEQRDFVEKGSTMYKFGSDCFSCRSPTSHHNFRPSAMVLEAV